jgi:hypothetical protein
MGDGGLRDDTQSYWVMGATSLILMVDGGAYFYYSKLLPSNDLPI